MSQKPEILYVDDEPINLQLFEVNFESKYRVHTAYSASEAMDVLKANADIRLVLSDMKMPAVDGLEFARMAKEEYAHIPFVLVTGFDISPEIVEAIEKGILKTYFGKPFDIDRMEEKIDELVGKSLT